MILTLKRFVGEVSGYYKEVSGYYKKERKIQNIAQLIGFYYVNLAELSGLDKMKYDKAREDVSSLGVTKIDFSGSIISITLTRPGLLIGRRGINIDNLTEYLSKELKHKISINIIEDKITGWLIPYEPYSDADLDSALFGE